jgi:SAM-dependent methyltransferase
MSKDMDALTHKELKQESYWDAMNRRPTTRHNRDTILALLGEHGPRAPQRIADIGCGTGHILQMMKERYPRADLFGLDYDPAAIRHSEERWGHLAKFVQADLFEMDKLGDGFDIVLLCDVLHEVYSFKARQKNGRVDSTKGDQVINAALDAVKRSLNPGGVLIITDSLLSEEDTPVSLEARSPAVLEAVKRVVSDYPSRELLAEFDGSRFRTSSRDLCYILTQYNKVKNGDVARWNVEKLEVHQYWCPSTFQTYCSEAGLSLFAINGTPEETLEEWETDFAILSGLKTFPTRRTSILARRENS